MALDHSDIIKLTQDPSGDTRSEIADKISREYLAGIFKDRERDITHEIFRIMVRDAETRVRRLLSVNLKNAMDLPHDIALTLAKDVEEVAIPMLETSFVLEEEDLESIVKSTNNLGILAAISRRETLSSEVVQALLEKEQERITNSLLVNTGSSLEERDIKNHLDHIIASETMLDSLVKRGGFSVQLAETIYDHVSDELKQVLAERYHLSRSVADELVKAAQEDITLDLHPYQNDSQHTQALIDSLHSQGRLEFSLIIRSLCQGKLEFFEMALSKLADIPLMNAKLLIMDPGTLGFKSLYQAASMPETFYPAIKALLEIGMEETSYGRYHVADYKKRIIERIMVDKCDERVDNMDYLVRVIRDDTAGEHVSFASSA